MRNLLSAGLPVLVLGMATLAWGLVRTRAAAHVTPSATKQPVAA